MKTTLVKIPDLSNSDVERMFEIMLHYYESITIDQFQSDLKEKESAILLLSENQKIQGFSTLWKKELVHNNQKFIAIFSGDTVLEKEYWGNGALPTAFGKYLIKVRLQYIFTPVYWFLMSKGYKTYLLMANNFPEHYPRYEKETPKKIKEFLNYFYIYKFKDLYNSQLGLVTPKGPSCHLKNAVSDIDQSLLLNPRIKFFVDRNPHWSNGIELACIARVSLWIPVKYFFKRIEKTLKKFR